ncbi:MAG TPA: Holliday junction resolvase RuvX [Firmicutes bacterium]|jgi:putative Holliday junction resolvase|nr:Holliday junction resolvase RuvX [Bacillota bacterium]
MILRSKTDVPEGRLIGIDLGLRRVGVSISDELACFAHPLCTIPYRNLEQVLEETMSLAATYKAVGFVVGIPKNMDGSFGESARRALNFARKLEARSGLPVVLWDERLTTSQAEREMIGLGMSRRRRRTAIDEAASVLILENYLRSVSNTHGNPKGSENVNNRDDRKTDNLGEQAFDDVIVLSDEDGNEEEFKLLLDGLFVGDRQYVVLMPADSEEDDQPEIVILRVDRLGEDGATLCTIDEEDEWEEVIGALYELDLEDDIEVEDYEDDDEEPGV